MYLRNDLRQNYKIQPLFPEVLICPLPQFVKLLFCFWLNFPPISSKKGFKLLYVLILAYILQFKGQVNFAFTSDALGIPMKIFSKWFKLRNS